MSFVPVHTRGICTAIKVIDGLLGVLGRSVMEVYH